MEISVNEARKLSIDILKSYNFTPKQAELTTKNLIEAELADKPSHGLVRLPAIQSQIKKGNLSLHASEYGIISESDNHLHIDGKKLPGFYLMYESLKKAISSAQNKVFSVGIKDGGYASGYIGAYAREATSQNLIFIGFNNSTGWTVPHGTTKGTWGTNPITVGIPSNKYPFIFDAASTKISIGDILVAKSSGTKIEENAALDSDGNLTTDPEKAYNGKGILPIAGHKGSGLAFVVELLAGALTNSRVGYSVPGGWGSFYILIDPTLFRAINKFKNDVDTSIQELKNLPKTEGVDEVFYPGEQSGNNREKALKTGIINVEKKLWGELKTIL